MLLYNSIQHINRMKKHIPHSTGYIIGILFLSLIVLNTTANAQVNERNANPENSFKSRLFYGGGFGLQFGSMTLIEFSPLAGYKITPKFGMGVSPTYKYYRFKDYYSTSTYSQTNVFGGSVFARYLVFENIFAHAEYESLSYNTKVPGSLKQMKHFNSLLVGGGYRQQISENAAMNLMVLWNLNDTPDSPYTNPVIRMGFSLGF
jgi:hypothetical protein